MTTQRAWVLLPSGNRLSILAPDPRAWTDRDLAIGLSRTYRWSGYSAWDHPLSVAQHSLTVLELRQHAAKRRLTPLKPHLGDGYQRLVALHQTAVDIRYGLPAWDEDAYRAHKAADHLAAASEAFHVVGWSRASIRDDLRITIEPVAEDPLADTVGFAPWEPWPASYAAERFLDALLLLTSDMAGISDLARNAELA